MRLKQPESKRNFGPGFDLSSYEHFGHFLAKFTLILTALFPNSVRPARSGGQQKLITLGLYISFKDLK